MTSGSTSQQYIYNWNTEEFAVGSCWRLFAQLDDDQTYYVDIGRR